MVLPSSIALVAACAFPTFNPTQLRGIKADATVLMSYPLGSVQYPSTQRYADVPEDRWPPTITAIKPAFVLVDETGVTIATKPFFDGGWGYFVPRQSGKNPQPQRYRDLGNGVYWYNPY